MKRQCVGPSTLLRARVTLVAIHNTSGLKEGSVITNDRLQISREKRRRFMWDRWIAWWVSGKWRLDEPGTRIGLKHQYSVHRLAARQISMGDWPAMSSDPVTGAVVRWAPHRLREH